MKYDGCTVENDTATAALERLVLLDSPPGMCALAPMRVNKSGLLRFTGHSNGSHLDKRNRIHIRGTRAVLRREP